MAAPAVGGIATIGKESRLAVEQQFARDAADPRIRERRDELAQGVRREYLTCIGEDDDLESRAATSRH